MAKKDVTDLPSRTDKTEGRLTAIENKLKPEQIATILEIASNDSKKLNKLFAKLFCEMIKEDKEIRALLKELIEGTDRDAIMLFWKKFGFAIWSSILFVLGSIVTAIVFRIIS